MIELTVIVICLIALLTYQYYASAKERKDLIRAILAKGLPEIVEAEHNDKIKPMEPDKPSEFIPVESLDDEGFIKMVKNQIKRKTE